MTPLLPLPWTQTKTTLPLDVLDSCDSTQVSHVYAVDVRVSVCVAPPVSISFRLYCVRVMACSRLDSVFPLYHPEQQHVVLPISKGSPQAPDQFTHTNPTPK